MFRGNDFRVKYPSDRLGIDYRCWVPTQADIIWLTEEGRSEKASLLWPHWTEGMNG